MAKRIFATTAASFTASAGGSAVALGSNSTPNWMALKGGSGTQLIDILEVLFSGKAAASVVMAMYLVRVATLEGAITALAAPQADGPMHPATAALAAPPVPFCVATTSGPVPSNAVTDGRLQLGNNGFGGIVRWNAAPTQQFTMLGNTASFGESILYNDSTGNGATALGDAHIIYEPY